MPHILFADDHPAVRLGFLRMAHLCCPDWQVSQAENGSDAVEQAEHLQPDLIVLDLSMPVMDGLAAARELKRRMPSVPLILWTSFESYNLSPEADAAGFGAVALKSGGGTALIDSIRRLLKESV